MTLFTPPLLVGDLSTGVPTTETMAHVDFTRVVDVSANGRSKTITLPDNAFIHTIRCVAMTSSNATQGVAVRVGDSTSATKYINFAAIVSASVYGGALTPEIVSAKTVIVDTTASVAASAGSFTAGKQRVFLGCGIYYTPIGL